MFRLESLLRYAEKGDKAQGGKDICLKLPT